MVVKIKREGERERELAVQILFLIAAGESGPFYQHEHLAVFLSLAVSLFVQPTDRILPLTVSCRTLK